MIRPNPVSRPLAARGRSAATAKKRDCHRAKKGDCHQFPLLQPIQESALDRKEIGWLSPFFASSALLIHLLLLICVTGSTLSGTSTKVWELSEYKDFLAGKFENISLSQEGGLTIAPALTPLFSSDQPVIWNVAIARDGTVYLGTGHQGRVYEVDKAGKSSLFWSAPEIEVFALAVAPDGSLYAGTSPNGKVYRVDREGKGEPFFDPKQTYIWSIVIPPAADRNDAGQLEIFVATGDQGKIYRVDSNGEGKLHADTKQRHVVSLALTPQGSLLAGTDPNGIIYRIEKSGKLFALYDSELPEVRALQVAPNGDIYAAAMGGGVSQITQSVSSAQTSAASSATTTINVTAAADSPPGPGGAKPQPSSSKQVTPQPVVTISQPVISYAGMEKAALLRIKPDLAADKLWTSTEENILALSLAGQDFKPVFATDRGGRIYQLEGERTARLLTESDQEQVTHLAPGPEGLLVAAAHSGRLSRLENSLAAAGTYRTAVHDAKTISRWGRLSWNGAGLDAAPVEFQTRSGNSARPDDSWSDWSEKITAEGGKAAAGFTGGAISSPPARYVQWRATLRNADGRLPRLRTVRLAYLPQNSAPVIRSVTVTGSTSPSESGTASAAGSATAGADASAAYSITVSASGAESPQAAGGNSQTSVGGGGKKMMAVSWQAEDADGDKLIATVSFREDQESNWKVIKKNIASSNLSIESESLADGIYRFRVEVSDTTANPPDTARRAERVSEPILVDHTPPIVSMQPVVSMQPIEGRASVRFEASDASSTLQQAEYSVDAGQWIPVFADDGITDSSTETFTIELGDLDEGEHLVTMRVRDRAGNAGLGKALVRGRAIVR